MKDLSDGSTLTESYTRTSLNPFFVKESINRLKHGSFDTLGSVNTSIEDAPKSTRSEPTSNVEPGPNRIFEEASSQMVSFLTRLVSFLLSILVVPYEWVVP